MTNILHFNSNIDKIYFWSDLHFCHAKDFILNPRGFSDSESHKKFIIDSWNSTVPEDGVVFLLGDSVIGAGKDSENVFCDLFSKLNYKEIYIMAGNHAAGYKSIFASLIKNERKIDEYYRLLTFFRKNSVAYFIPNYYEIRIDGVLNILSHYPLVSWNEMGKGSMHFFGHVHSNLDKKQWLLDNYLIGRCLEVTPEKIRKPISFLEAKEILEKRSPLQIDHH